jgi:hypothetical protein
MSDPASPASPVVVVASNVEVVNDAHDLIPMEPEERKVFGLDTPTDGVNRPNKYAAKRTKWQREVDLLDLAEMLTKRLTIRDMTATLNKRNRDNGVNYELSREQIRKDCKEVMQRWTEEFVGGSLKARKAAELAFLDRIEREAWEVYERTKRDESSGSQTTSGTAAALQDPNGNPNGAGRSINIIKTVAKAQRDGEVGPLLLLVKISEHRAKLLGMNSPARIEVEDATDEHKRKRLEAIKKAYRAKVERDIVASGGKLPDNPGLPSPAVPLQEPPT